jgi:hypothetical protein
MAAPCCRPGAPRARSRPSSSTRCAGSAVVSLVDVLIPLVTLTAGAALALVFLRRGWRGDEQPPPSTAKILFPLVGSELSERALEAALRLARVERATVVPAYLASVPLPLTLDASFPRTCDEAFSVLEAIGSARRARECRLSRG